MPSEHAPEPDELSGATRVEDAAENLCGLPALLGIADDPD